jgi:hypothetical protein
MKKWFSKIRNKINNTTAAVRVTLTNNRAEGYVDTAVKILMAVVIGALVLAGLYALFNDTVLPTLVKRVQEMFNYGAR